jgi:hypothetical protein
MLTPFNFPIASESTECYGSNAYATTYVSVSVRSPGLAGCRTFSSSQAKRAAQTPCACAQSPTPRALTGDICRFKLHMSHAKSQSSTTHTAGAGDHGRGLRLE